MLRDRSAFAYMEPDPDTREFAQCGTCPMFLRKVGRCHWLGANDDVDDDDSCVMYVQGKPDDDPGAKPVGALTPDAVGFFSGKVRCENCNAGDFRDSKRPHCDLYVQLNRMLPKLWDLEIKIKPHACCNAFSPGGRNPRQFGPLGPIGRTEQMLKRGMISPSAMRMK